MINNEDDEDLRRLTFRDESFREDLLNRNVMNLAPGRSNSKEKVSGIC